MRLIFAHTIRLILVFSWTLGAAFGDGPGRDAREAPTREAVERAVQDLASAELETRQEAFDHLLEWAIADPLLLDRLPSEHPILETHAALERLREYAAGRLPEDANPPVSILVKLLKHAEAEVRATATLTLGRLGERPAAPAIVRLLEDPYIEVRLAAVSVLGTWQEKSSANEIAKRLKDGCDELRAVAADTLGWLGATWAAPQIEALLNENELVRDMAVYALGRLGSRSSSRRIAERLVDCIDETSAEVLAYLGDKSVAPKMIEVLEKADDWEDQRQAADILGAIDDKSVAPRLVGLLRTGDATVQAAAVRALGAMREKSAAEPICEFLEYEVAVYRIEAVTALGKIGDRSVAPKIAKLLEDREEEVRVAAVEALEALGDTSFVQSIAGRLEDTSAAVREKAVDALGRIGDRSLAPRLARLLEDEDPDVSEAAIGALMSLGDPSILPIVEKRIEEAEGHPKEHLYFFAPVEHLVYLRRLGKEPPILPRVVEALEEDLHDGETYHPHLFRCHGCCAEEDHVAALRVGSADDLATLGAKASVPKIARLLDDPELWVRSRASRSLEKLAGQSWPGCDLDRVEAARAWWAKHKTDPEYQPK